MNVSPSLPAPSLTPQAPHADIGTVDRSPETPVADAGSPAVHTIENARTATKEPASPLADGLPTPDVFGDSPGEWRGEKAAGETTLTGVPSEAAIHDAAHTVAKGRIAPPLSVKPPRITTPQPSARPDSPTVTPPPEPTIVQPDAKPKKKAPPTRQVTPKEYIVKKGDTVRKIIKAEYGRASTKIVAFLVSANKGQIKNKDTIIAGQKLMLPPLPPELFEPAPSFDVSRLAGGVRTVTSAELSGSNASRTDQRVAPGPALKGVKTTGQTANPALKFRPTRCERKTR